MTNSSKFRGADLFVPVAFGFAGVVFLINGKTALGIVFLILAGAIRANAVGRRKKSASDASADVGASNSDRSD